MELKFPTGTQVVVVDGDFTGLSGIVKGYEFERYLVVLQGVKTPKEGQYFAYKEEELDFLESEDPSEEEEVDEIHVPEFGMSAEAFERHLEYLIGRSLEHVGKIGPEQAFFGFQEFEGKTASEVLLSLMTKLEEGMALFAQAHILIGRIVVALEQTHDQT
jgi:ribosomal protein L24